MSVPLTHTKHPVFLTPEDVKTEVYAAHKAKAEQAVAPRLSCKGSAGALCIEFVLGRICVFRGFPLCIRRYFQLIRIAVI